MKKDFIINRGILFPYYSFSFLIDYVELMYLSCID